MDLDHQKNLVVSDLARLLKSEIKSYDKKIPADFGFRIMENDDPDFEPTWSDCYRAFSYNSCQSDKFSLHREFDGEGICLFPEIPSQMPKDDSWQFNLFVMISKGMKLLFKVTASADDITVDSVSVKMPSDGHDSLYGSNPPPYTLDKEGNLQCAFREYLKTRGITKTANHFLYDYMVWKRRSRTKQSPAHVIEKLHEFIKD